jgi:hypothetical protein
MVGRCQTRLLRGAVRGSIVPVSVELLLTTA